MTQSRISRAEATPVRVVLITLDHHLAGVVARARARLVQNIPGLELTLHAATDWDHDPDALEMAKAAIAAGDIIVATMLFMDDHIRAIRPALEARRETCDAMLVAMSAPDVMKLTRLGAFRMDAPQKGILALLKKLRGTKAGGASGAGQMAMLRRLPQILRFIPGKAQDVRAYFLTLQFWLSGSEENITSLVRGLIDRYAAGPRLALAGTLKAAAPINYPEVGLYHPGIKGRISESIDALPRGAGQNGTVGVLLLRSYVLAGDTGHYDGVLAALEAKGLTVIPAFASGLDARPALERFFMADGSACVDAIVSLTGFSLVGGPAYNDAAAAERILARMDVPYIAAQPVEFQSLERWSESAVGLTPVEATMMVAIPELDGAIAPIVFGGRAEGAGPAAPMRADPERAAMLSGRVARLIALRRTAKRDKRIAVVLYNFPPNAGATGSAAYLSVFASLHNTLCALRRDGYDVEIPASVDALRARILAGNSAQYGTDANVHARITVDAHVRGEQHLAAIEAEWGTAPGRQLTDGRHILIQGERFGNVFVGLQPGFGYEGDPMRLLFEKGCAPTHAFAAFYRYLREEFAADAVLHFGTHGALEFMPGKQVGLSGSCWPERLLGDLPNIYLYAANNPSEGAIAKRRAAATLVSYLTPAIAKAGLYRGLQDLKEAIERWRRTDRQQTDEIELRALIRDLARAVDLDQPDMDWEGDAPSVVTDLAARLYELEQTLVPEGLHEIGRGASPAARRDTLCALAVARGFNDLPMAAIEALISGATPVIAARKSGLPPSEATQLFTDLANVNAALCEDHEVPAILHALEGGFIRPSPGGDLLRTPAVLPTGRNLHGFDPFRIPSAFAMREGKVLADQVLTRHREQTGRIPESIALVLWGTDNLKTEGGPIAQALALIGAAPRFDAYGRLCGGQLLPLETLGRPRIDVLMTLSGIFRDLLPLQIRMLAEVAWLAASADEPAELNFVRKHALAHQAALGCDLETAALRVFSNAEGAYGANVNHLIDAGCWTDESELADAYEARKSFAYGATGRPTRRPELLGEALKGVEIAYQNLDSLELGVTSIDHYVDTLGGISRAAQRARGGEGVAVYVGDQTQGSAKVRTLAEQVAIETRTRMLNPRWYESLLQHGYEGVRQIEAQVTNTLGWSAATGDVAPWIYQRISETYVLDPEMRARLAALNPKASVRMANRLIEAHERHYWQPEPEMLEALRHAGDELEDRLEGVAVAAE